MLRIPVDQTNALHQFLLRFSCYISIYDGDFATLFYLVHSKEVITGRTTRVKGEVNAIGCG